VTSFDELRALPMEVTKGKIVVYNQRCNWTAQPVNCYGETVQYRVEGAIEAAKVAQLHLWFELLEHSQLLLHILQTCSRDPFSCNFH